jgi:hypothetical protein
MEKRSMDDLTQAKLQKLTVPIVDMKQHQVQLRRALLAASHPANQTTKKRWSNLMTKPKFIVSSVTLAFTALALMAFCVFANLSPASAAELTQHSLNKVVQLSPAEQKELDMRVKGDPKAELEAAKNAKDLTVLTYAQLQESTPQPDGIAIHGPDSGTPGPSTLDPTSLKYLRYTDAQGATHIIGVGKDGLPSLVMVFSTKNGAQSGSVKVNSSGASKMTMGGSSTAGTDSLRDSASCSNVNGQVTCTTSGGGSPECKTFSDGKVTCTQAPSTQDANQ